MHNVLIDKGPFGVQRRTETLRNVREWRAPDGDGQFIGDVLKCLTILDEHLAHTF